MSAMLDLKKFMFVICFDQLLIMTESFLWNLFLTDCLIFM